MSTKTELKYMYTQSVVLKTVHTVSIPTTRRIIGNSKGEGGSRKLKFLKKSLNKNSNFWGSGVGEWIFSGTAMHTSQFFFTVRYLWVYYKLTCVISS